MKALSSASSGIQKYQCPGTAGKMKRNDAHQFEQLCQSEVIFSRRGWASEGGEWNRPAWMGKGVSQRKQHPRLPVFVHVSECGQTVPFFWINLEIRIWGGDSQHFKTLMLILVSKDQVDTFVHSWASLYGLKVIQTPTIIIFNVPWKLLVFPFP